MKTIILILAAIATTTFAICLDAQGQRLSLPEGQADSQIPLPAQFRVSVEKGIITLRDVNSGKVLGRTTFERLGVVTPTQDKLRHVALDVTAAVVAGNGSRKRIVNPFHKVYTVADHKKRFITGHEDRAAEATVMQAGASGFFIKPLDNEKFIAAVQDALEQA